MTPIDTKYIHAVLNKIAFQYYPLDLNSTSNPFLVSWWPLALGDPALFHVSLQTACLDEELIAQKGFNTSELLMADSLALVRRKVQDTSLACQDGTMNSVITLATIEVRDVGIPIQGSGIPLKASALTRADTFSSEKETLCSQRCTLRASRSWST
jgi:hypothetical protein